MSVAFSQCRALLANIASNLANEAGDVGLTSLQSALNNFQTEISSTNAGISEGEFFGGPHYVGTNTTELKQSAAIVWATTLNSAAAMIRDKQLSNIRSDTNSISTSSNSIATSTANISTQTTTIATSSVIISSSSTIIAQKHTDIESHQQRMIELAEGSGVHVVGPYEIFGMITQYRTMIEQGQILDFSDVKTKAKVQHALDVMNDYAAKIRRNIPREWG